MFALSFRKVPFYKTILSLRGGKILFYFFLADRYCYDGHLLILHMIYYPKVSHEHGTDL